jgi:NAD(P)H dehydrogenase (quinone)
MKVAVTAASGHLGAQVIQKLKQETGNENIVGIARTPEKAKHLGVEIRKGDYNNRNDFDIALKGIDVVLLISGMEAPNKRIGQHRNVINTAKDAGVRKIVYTSIFGKEGESTFDAIVNCNRQTEQDIQKSGLDWSIGRNGLYIEPDIEYIEKYKEAGEIANCAGEGLASYTTRPELAYAYTQMMLNDDRNGKIFKLSGDPLTQTQLAGYLNKAFGTNLIYREMSPEEYLKFQQKVNGDFLGMVIAGIYTKIRNGESVMNSDFMEAAGREHISWEKYFEQLAL